LKSYQLVGAQVGKRVGAPRSIAKLNQERSGTIILCGKILDYRSNLAMLQALLGNVLKQSNDLE